MRALSRTALLCALLLPGIAPAAAEEIAYLMYIRGTEGKTTPFRVLWDGRDDANGRLTIDFGVGYEAFLKKLGLPRVVAYDALYSHGDFVVRNDELARFVKIVCTEIVRPPERASLAPRTAGAAGAPPEADVKAALLLITPAPDKSELEVTVRLHVSYPAPQKSGPPIVKDFVNGDIVFVGQPEPKPPAETPSAQKPPARKSR
jgi:hypothetical protein